VVDLNSGGYATVSDLADSWVDDVPDNAVRLLRSASLRVAQACQRNPYADVPAGAEAAALRDATCAQAAVWITSGIDPADLGVTDAAVKSTSILDAKVDYDTAAQAKARADAVAGLTAEAVDILTVAGLLWVPVPLSRSGWLPSYGLSGPRPWGSGLSERELIDADAWPFF
jgi:hypothetical protein